mmetsp:Transcript_5449/g.11855  ORF Transcript_5449/g.11855 Transcript_5449/m.11855 type:complete len:97 (+) Transcript_5449:150-440(+)
MARHGKLPHFLLPVISNHLEPMAQLRSSPPDYFFMLPPFLLMNGWASSPATIPINNHMHLFRVIPPIESIIPILLLRGYTLLSSQMKHKDHTLHVC